MQPPCFVHTSTRIAVLANASSLYLCQTPLLTSTMTCTAAVARVPAMNVTQGCMHAQWTELIGQIQPRQADSQPLAQAAGMMALCDAQW